MEEFSEDTEKQDEKTGLSYSVEEKQGYFIHTVRRGPDAENPISFLKMVVQNNIIALIESESPAGQGITSKYKLNYQAKRFNHKRESNHGSDHPPGVQDDADKLYAKLAPLMQEGNIEKVLRTALENVETIDYSIKKKEIQVYKSDLEKKAEKSEEQVSTLKQEKKDQAAQHQEVVQGYKKEKVVQEEQHTEEIQVYKQEKSQLENTVTEDKKALEGITAKLEKLKHKKAGTFSSEEVMELMDRTKGYDTQDGAPHPDVKYAIDGIVGMAHELLSAIKDSRGPAIPYQRVPQIEGKEVIDVDPRKTSKQIKAEKRGIANKLIEEMTDTTKRAVLRRRFKHGKLSSEEIISRLS